MSALPLILDVISTPHLLTAAAGDQAGGIFDWITTKNTQALTAIRAVAVTIAVIFVVWAAISSRGSFVKILMAGIAAGVMLYIIFNVTDIQDRVGNEVNSASAITATYYPGHIA